MKTKAKTIDELCGKPPGSFKKFIQQEEENLRLAEQERKDRIREHRKKI